MRTASLSASQPRVRAVLDSTAVSVICLVVTVGVYVLLAYQYATRVPIWNAPDEPAHYNYVRHVATTASLPVLQPGDYDVTRVERLMSLKFPPSEPVDWMRYESHQPPLYYALAAPAYWLMESWPLERQIVGLRLLSVGLGAVLVVVCFLLVREAAPSSPSLQRFTPAFVAFVPMHVAMTAAINNDTLAELLLALTLWALVGGLRWGMSRRRVVALGVLLGLILLTKVVAYAAVPVAVLALYGAARVHARPTENPLRRWISNLVVAGLIAAVVSAWWFVRNAVVYGNLDVFGLRRHDLVVVGQPLTGPLDREAIERFVLTTFRSFWGQFGWMAAPLSDRDYWLLFGTTALAALGLLLYALRVVQQEALVESWRRWTAAIVVATVVLVGGGVVIYNLTYLQAQGRYLFPALVGLATLFGVGWREVWNARYQGLMLGLWSVGLAVLALWSLVRVVVPYFR